MTSGWIYALVNSAMPGLVKVGKTTRSASDRANELSGATGVPTPFIVAYQRYFNDCDAAELYLHMSLRNQGYRESPNREFFRADTTHVVDAIVGAPDIKIDDLVSGPASIRLGSDVSGDGVEARSWSHLEEQGCRALNGHGDELQDPLKARDLFLDAGQLGSPTAFEFLGHMYLYANGVGRDLRLALKYFQSGVDHGNYLCFVGLATAYGESGHVQNSIKCWTRFFKSHNETADKYDCSAYITDHDDYMVNVQCFVMEHWKNEWPEAIARFLAPHRQELLNIFATFFGGKNATGKQSDLNRGICDALKQRIPES